MIPTRCYFDMSDYCVAYENQNGFVIDRHAEPLLDSGVYEFEPGFNPIGMSALQLFGFGMRK